MTTQPERAVELQEKAIPEDASVVHGGIQSLFRRSMFWRPTYLAPSAWFEHIPFAYWLIDVHRPSTFVELGTHNGTSYFAFCQAVERLGLSTSCYAIDTWKGDQHAGFYDETAFQQVSAHNEAQYSGFSRLVRSSFDDALEHFSDHSIDLLHIDGLHTYEAVAHDFMSWLPKLSSRAIVVMHDINVRERHFGVFKLFEELKREYPHFEFMHGHGLGVVQVGADQNELSELFFSSKKKASYKQSVQEVFGRLGRSCADTFAITQGRQLADKLKGNIVNLEKVRRELEVAKAELNSKSGQAVELARACDIAAAATLTADGLRDRVTELEAQATRFEREIHDVTGERERQRAVVAEQAEALDRTRKEAEAVVDGFAARVRELEDQTVQLKQQIERTTNERDLHQAAFAGQAVELALARDEARSAEQALRQLESQVVLFKKEIDGLNADSQAKSISIADRFREIATLTKLLMDRDEELAGLAAMSDKLREALAEKEAECQRLNRELLEMTTSKAWRVTKILRLIVNPFAGLTVGRWAIRRDARFIRRSAFFDRTWYLVNNPDVAQSGMDPAEHYARFGAKEGRNPGPAFDTKYYLAANTDVAASTINPLVHFVRFGEREGRSPRAHQ